MRLKVLLPSAVLVDEEVTKVTAEGQGGSFCLLPRHIDFVSVLPPGILAYWTDENGESLLAIDEGVLVKAGDDVLVSASNAVAGERVGELRKKVEESFERMDERRKKVTGAAARLEADLVRRFVELD